MTAAMFGSNHLTQAVHTDRADNQLIVKDIP